MQETWVQSLGWEDPLEEGMATYSSILAWKNPQGQRSLVGYSPRCRHPIFPSSCEGKLGFALESLQGRRDLT